MGTRAGRLLRTLRIRCAAVCRAAFEIDGRSFRLAQLMLGLLCVYDVLMRFVLGDVRLYTDEFSTRCASMEGLDMGQISVYNAGGTRAFVYSLGLLHISMALCYALNVWPRATGPATWLLQMSLAVRALHTGNGADAIMHQLLLWMCLAGATAARTDGTTGKVVTHACVVPSAAAAGLCLLVPFIYTKAGLGKLSDGGPEWHVFGWKPWLPPNAKVPTPNLDAVALTLCIDQWLLPAGFAARGMLLRRPWTTQLLTAATLAIEVPCVLAYSLLPALRAVIQPSVAGVVAAQMLRGVLVLPLCLFIASMGTLLLLNLFPLVMCVGMLVHVPAAWWDGGHPAVAAATATLKRADNVGYAVRELLLDLCSSAEDDTVPNVPAPRKPGSGRTIIAARHARRRRLFHAAWRALGRGTAWVLLGVMLYGSAASLVNSSTGVARLPMEWLEKHGLFAVQMHQGFSMFDNHINNYGGWRSVRGTVTSTKNRTAIDAIDVLRSLQAGRVVAMEAWSAMADHLPSAQALHGSHRWMMTWAAMRKSPRHNQALGELLCRMWNHGQAEDGGAPGWFAAEFPLASFQVADIQNVISAIDTDAAASQDLCVATQTAYQWFNFTCPATPASDR